MHPAAWTEHERQTSHSTWPPKERDQVDQVSTTPGDCGSDVIGFIFIIQKEILQIIKTYKNMIVIAVEVFEVSVQYDSV